jgi:hypothetical protein
MAEFIRPIHKCIEDLFILDIEALCYLTDHLKHYIPDSLSESKFHATLSSILEEGTHGFVVREPFGGRERIVLHGRCSFYVGHLPVKAGGSIFMREIEPSNNIAAGTNSHKYGSCYS